MVSFNWTALTVGILILVVVVIAAIAVRRRLPRDEQNSDLRALWHTLLALSAAATFLLLHLSWPLCQYLPKLAFVQFPWRWLAVGDIPYRKMDRGGPGSASGRTGTRAARTAAASVSGLASRTEWQSDDTGAFQGFKSNRSSRACRRGRHPREFQAHAGSPCGNCFILGDFSDRYGHLALCLAV